MERRRCDEVRAQQFGFTDQNKDILDRSRLGDEETGTKGHPLILLHSLPVSVVSRVGFNRKHVQHEDIKSNDPEGLTIELPDV